MLYSVPCALYLVVVLALLSLVLGTFQIDELLRSAQPLLAYFHQVLQELGDRFAHLGDGLGKGVVHL